MDERERIRAALLRVVWQEILATKPENVRNFPAAERAIRSGASVEDMVTAMRAASYETAFRLLYLIATEHAPDDKTAADFDRGWTLVDVDLANLSADPSSALDGVHEDLLEADPSGRGGEDLWS